MSSTLRRWTLAGSILLAAGALTACAAHPGGGDAADPVGTRGDTATRTEPSLVLADDGGLTGTDGCNRLVGSWTADGANVTFSQVASTRMACEGVDDWLSGLATAVVSGDTLTVSDASGAEIGTLERATE